MDAAWDAIMAGLGERGSFFDLFDRYRMRPDAWLKIEVLHTLSGLTGPGGIRELRPDRQGCDLWFKSDAAEWWLAVKGLITSYAGAAREARPTVVSIEEIARELDKLRGLAALAGGNSALILAAFAFGPEPRERAEWQTQLLRFEAKGFTPAREATLPLRGNRECRLYLLAQ
jgi:hypothetical protein